jgi:threonine dehydrogenase-like Zn-dependent dehydrogenase
MALASHIVELLGPKQIHVRTEDIDIARLKSAEVCARTICSVISPGTEVAAYRGDPPLRPMRAYPRVVGYCNVAEVVACGDDASSLRPGERVLTGQSHRSAFVCRQDQILACVPTSMQPIEAATTYLFQLGYNAVSKGDLQKGQALAVVGLGTLGLATAAIAGISGAHVYAFSNQEFAEDTLRKFGVRRLFRKSDQSALRSIADDTGADGVDLVVSTSNSWTDWRLVLSLPRKNGTICVLGFPGRGMAPPDFNPLSSEFFYDRQLRIIACGMTPEAAAAPPGAAFTLQNNCRLVLDCIARKLLPASALISAVAPWREIGSIYERIALPEPGFLTAALTWD